MLYRGIIILLISFCIFPHYSRGQVQLQFESNTYDADTALISELMRKAYYCRQRNIDSGILLYEKVLALGRKHKINDDIAKALIALGLLYMDKGDFEKSLSYYRMAEPFCKKSSYNHGSLLANLYSNMGATYGNRGLQDSALYYYYQALRIGETAPETDTLSLVLLYSNIGIRLTETRHYEQAKFYLKKAEALAIQAQTKKMLAKIYSAMAMLYGSVDSLKAHRRYASLSADIFRAIHDTRGEMGANSLLAHSYLNEKKPDKALSYFKLAYYKDTTISPSFRITALIGIAGSYFEMKEYKLAEKYFKETLAISEASGIADVQMESLKYLADIYKELNNYKQALNYSLQYNRLKDSLSNKEFENHNDQLEAKYRSAEKDKELARQLLTIQQKENLLETKNRLIVFAGIVSVLSLALFATLYRSRQHKKNIERHKFEKDKLLAQLKARMEGEEKERERIARELHDGIMVQFSAAQMNLSSLLAHGDTKHAEELENILVLLEDTTKELRKSAHNLMPDMLLRDGLAEATFYFMKTLERSSDIKTDFQLIGSMPPIERDYELMFYRIIQELLQNVIKHAQASFVIVQIHGQPDMISIVVEDNGIGWNTEQPAKGMGLVGIKSRIQSLNGNISINSKPGQGTSVYIELETVYLQPSNKKQNVH